MHQSNQIFIDAFKAGDVSLTRNLLSNSPGSFEADSSGYRAPQLLRDIIESNGGHCHRKNQLEIADLFLSDPVREFRSIILDDNVDAARNCLTESPELVNAEFTAGRGLSQGIHHIRSFSMGDILLNAGADIHAKTSVRDGDTPLGMQLRAGNVELVEYLLGRGADPNRGVSCHMPSQSMDTLVAMLLKHDWDLKAHSSILLHDASHGLGGRICSWLRFGAEPNVQNGDGETALHILCRRGTGKSAIMALAKAGADLTLKNRHGETPENLARQATSDSALECLMKLLR